MPGDAAQLVEGTSRMVKKVGGRCGGKYLHTKIPTNVPPSHSDTSSLPLVVSALQVVQQRSAQCSPGGDQGREAPLAAGVKTSRSNMYVSSGNTKASLFSGKCGGTFNRVPPALHTS